MTDHVHASVTCFPVARGVKLGGMRDATMQRNVAAVAAADAAAARVSAIVLPLRRSNATLQQIADALNGAKVPTPRGKQWQAMSVSNALKRLAPRADARPPRPAGATGA